MLTSYLRRLSDNAAGIDTDAFEDVIFNKTGMTFVSEIMRIADAVGGLILSALVDIGTANTTVTLCRRRIWLDTCSLRDSCLDQWMKHPTPGGGGLFWATTDCVAAYEAGRASKEALQTVMDYVAEKPFTPFTPDHGGRGGSSPSTAANTLWGVYQARASRGKSRGKYHGESLQQPQTGVHGHWAKGLSQ